MQAQTHSLTLTLTLTLTITFLGLIILSDQYSSHTRYEPSQECKYVTKFNSHLSLLTFSLLSCPE